MSVGSSAPHANADGEGVLTCGIDILLWNSNIRIGWCRCDGERRAWSGVRACGLWRLRDGSQWFGLGLSSFDRAYGGWE